MPHATVVDIACEHGEMDLAHAPRSTRSTRAQHTRVQTLLDRCVDVVDAGGTGAAHV